VLLLALSHYQIVVCFQSACSLVGRMQQDLTVGLECRHGTVESEKQAMGQVGHLIFAP